MAAVVAVATAFAARRITAAAAAAMAAAETVKTARRARVSAPFLFWIIKFEKRLVKRKEIG